MSLILPSTKIEGNIPLSYDLNDLMSLPMIEQLLFSGIWGEGGDSNDPMIKGGQTAFITPGAFYWTVPDGVTEVSVVIISAGLQARAQSGALVNPGNGGSVRWKNKIPVVPGEVYRVVVGSGGIRQDVPFGTMSYFQLDYASSAFDIDVGITTDETTPVGDNMGGNVGTIAGGGTSNNIVYAGGNASGFVFTGNATPMSRGTDLFGRVINPVSPSGGRHGGGGSAQAKTSGSRVCGRGGDGGVKIIWGKGRAFPSTNITDVI